MENFLDVCNTFEFRTAGYVYKNKFISENELKFDTFLDFTWDTFKIWKIKWIGFNKTGNTFLSLSRSCRSESRKSKKRFTVLSWKDQIMWSCESTHICKWHLMSDKMHTNSHTYFTSTTKPRWQSAGLLSHCNVEQVDGSCQLMISI